MTQPTFSILMPAYGTERYIAESIESVVGQSRTDWELVVVDDGSPDHLVDRVAPYLSDRRVRLVRQENAGLAAALNRAAGESRAPYLVKLDSDDYLLESYLEMAGGILDARPEVGLVACDALVLDERSGRFLRAAYSRAYPRGPHRAKGRLERLIRQNFVLSIAAIRRSSFDELGGFDVDRRVVEDWDLWLRLISRGIDLEIVDRPHAVYRRRFPSLSRDESGADRLAPRVEHTLNKVMRELDLTPSEHDVARASLARCRAIDKMGRARHALLEGDTRAAQQLVRESLAIQATPRAMAVYAALRVAPAGLRTAHRSKSRLLQSISTVRAKAAPE